MAFDIERIKRDARNARRTQGTSPTAYLNTFARKNGYQSWHSLLALQAAGPAKKALAVPSAPVKAPRLHPLRNLLVLGINELLARNLISLEGGNEDTSHLHTVIGGRPSVILWTGIGCDELRVSVWWDYDHSQHPQANLQGNSRETFVTSSPLAKEQHYPKFVGATVSGWLERQSGRYLMGSGRDRLFDTYVRRSTKPVLDAIPSVAPVGYEHKGKFIF